MKILLELKQRWKAETPIFWKKVLKLAKWVIGCAASVWAANGLMNLGLDPVFLNVLKYTIVAGIVTGLNAKITKTDSNG